MTAVEMLLALWKGLKHHYRKAVDYAADFFSGLAIRFKLSINIAVVVVMVIVIFSSLILPIQRRVLDKATQDTCEVIIKSLSKRIQDPLLFSVANPDTLAEVVVEVSQTMQIGIKGLRYVLVFDRNGKLVVSSDPQNYRAALSPNRFAALVKSDQYTIQETNKFSEYYYPVNKRDPKGDGKIPVGLVCLGFSRTDLAEPIIGTKYRILALAALVVVVSVWGIYFFAQKMVHQIHDLSRAAREVGNGNLEVYVPARNKDELGQLAQEFNSMVTHIREKLQMQKFLSKLTVQMIHQTGGVRVEPYEGERRNVTILFSDVRNFSAIAEESEPEQVVRLINIYFELQTRIIEANGGVVDKFMGDQIMAVFQGANMLQEAVRAAVEIQRAVKKLNCQRSQAGEVTFELGIGINNGLAIIGNMGSKNRMDYTVIGDVVNIANRLCSLARSGQIIAEYSIAKSLNGAHRATHLDSIIVKGRSKPVEISEIKYELDYA